MSTAAVTRRMAIPFTVVSLIRIGVISAIVLGLGFMFAENSFYMRLAASAAIFYLLVGGYNVIFGYAGLFSLAQVAFAGIAGYTSVVLQARYELNFWLSLVIAVALVAVIAVLLAAPTSRLTGAFFALATLAFAEAIHDITMNWTDVTGGAQGFLGIQPPEFFGIDLVGGSYPYFVLSAVFAIVGFEVLYRLAKSGATRRMVAIRESLAATQAVGINPIRVRVLAFAISGIFAAIAGVLIAHNTLFISPETYSLGLMIETLIVNLIGGAGSILGPIIGVAALVMIDEFASFIGSANILVFGVAIVAILSFAPAGLVGIGRSVLRRFGRRRPSKVPPTTSLSPSTEPLAVGTVDADRRTGQVLAVEGIDLRFEGVHAIDDVSLSLASGEVLGLIGPNGAGKTSLVNVISGLSAPTAGTVTLNGDSLLGMKPYQIASVGVVRTFQSSQLVTTFDLVSNVMLGRSKFAKASVLENVLNTGRSRRDDRDAFERSMELLALVGVAEHAKEIVDDLPYGVVRRAEIARAMAMEPSFVLLDEPGAGLSQFEREEVAVAIRAVSATGTGVLLIDHNVGFVQSVSERIVVLSNGRVLAAGATDEVLANADVVAAYLGERGVQ